MHISIHTYQVLHANTVECHLVLEERDPVVHDSMNEFGEDMLSEISQLQKHKSCMDPLICICQVARLTKA